MNMRATTQRTAALAIALALAAWAGAASAAEKGPAAKPKQPAAEKAPATTPKPPPRLAPAPGKPASPVRLVTASVGFGTSARRDKWAAVRFLLDNTSPEEADVTVVAFAGGSSDGGQPAVVTRALVHLPANATRRDTLYLNVEGSELTLEVYDKQVCVSSQTYPCSGMAPRDTLTIGISALERGYSVRERAGGRGMGPQLYFKNPSLGDLPTRWAGYAPADAVVVGSLPPEGITVPQERAMVEWVRAGGVLILCPGADAHYAGTAFEELSPVALVGYRKVEDVPPLAALYGAIPAVQERIGLAEAVVRSGIVTLEMDGLPLVVRRPEGGGEVVFVAFDLSAERLTQWFGLDRFYRDVIERKGALPKTADTAAAQQAASALAEAVGVRVLSWGVLAVCLAVNLACVIGVIYILRRRREYAFLALVAIAPVMAFSINLVGYLASGVSGGMLTARHVIRSESGRRECSGTGYYALLSPREARCDARMPDNPSAFFRGISTRLPAQGMRSPVGAMREGLKFLDGDIKSLTDLHILPRAVTLFQADYGATLPGVIEAAASVTPKGIRFNVRNRSGSRLADAWAVCNRSAAPLGNVAPGAEATVLLDSAAARGWMAGFSSGSFRFKEDLEHEGFLRSLYAAQRASDLYDTGATVFGWVDDQPVALELAGLNASPAVSGKTLWAVAAERAAPPHKTPLLFPKGTLSMQFSDLDKLLIEGGLWRPIGRALETSNHNDLNVVFALPPEIADLQPSRITFFMRFGRVTAPITIEALNARTGKYDPVIGEPAARGLQPAETAQTQFNLSQPDQYFSHSSRTVTLRVQIRPEIAQGPTLTVRRPTLEDFDLEIEGTSE